MSDSPIDDAIFGEFQDVMGAEFVGELVTTFFDEAPAMLAELKTAADVGDKDQFRRAAHSIKSNASIFGALGLAEQARQMEINELDPGADDTEAEIDRLVAEYQRAAKTLTELING